MQLREIMSPSRGNHIIMLAIFSDIFQEYINETEIYITLYTTALTLCFHLILSSLPYTHTNTHTHEYVIFFKTHNIS